MNVRRSLGITFVAKYLELALSLLGGMVLARLLTPEDFGIYTIAASVVMLGYLLRNFGVGQFIVQIKEVTDDVLRAAFAVTLAFSWSVGLLLVLIAPWLGEVYSEDGVTQVLYFLSLNFLLLPFGSVTNALLKRRMQFEKIAVINICAAVTSLVVGLTAAWHGEKYMSIAWASNASTLVSVFVTQLYRPAAMPWLPGVRRFREVLAFGFKVGAMDVFNTGSDAGTELLIGRAQGLYDLGMYSRAYGTYRLFEFAFVQTVRPVVLPFLSKAKHEEENLGEIYINIISLTAIFSIPFFTFLGINAAQVMELLYGDQWGVAVPVVQIMCLAGLLFSPTLFFEQLLIANGRPGQAFRFIATSQVLRLTALAFLAWVSLQAAAVALIVGFGTRLIVMLLMARQHFTLKFGEFVRAVAPAIFTAIALGGASLGARFVLAGQNAFLLLLGSAGAAFLVWIALIFLLQHPITSELRGIYAKLVQR